MADKKQQPIQMANLSLAELNNIKEALESEIQQLTQSYAQLKIATGRFEESKDTLKTLKPENDNKKILAPLTSSLYVPAQTTDIKNVLIDVGTGYYVEKGIPEADEFFAGKIKLLKQNSEKVEAMVNSKRSQLESVIMLMRVKVEQQQHLLQKQQAS